MPLFNHAIAPAYKVKAAEIADVLRSMGAVGSANAMSRQDVLVNIKARGFACTPRALRYVSAHSRKPENALAHLEEVILYSPYGLYVLSNDTEEAAWQLNEFADHLREKINPLQQQLDDAEDVLCNFSYEEVA